MSKRVLVLVEDQTEERFVKDVLAPYFYSKNLYFYPTLLITKRIKDGPSFKGGITSFAKFENDLNRLINHAGDALITTMLDYYGLPSDFPGMDSRPTTGTLESRVVHVEKKVLDNFGSPSNLTIFFVLHEFEAWLFSSPNELPRVMTESAKQPAFAAIRMAFKTPEEINERPQYAPSKRIKELFPAYKKTLHGPITTSRIGLEIIRAQCPHFNGWINKLENYAGSSS
jgi:hypothetical protein